MRRSTLPKIGFPLLLFLLMGGCTTFPRSNSSAKEVLPDAKKYRFSDLPVPVGLSLNVDQSFIFESPGTRAGRLVYSGNRKYENVVRFFREKMPEHGWKLVSSFERGGASLTFEKPGWVVGIFIRPSTFTTHVDISIGPREKPFVERDIPPR